MNASPFDRPEENIAWAREAINELDAAFRSFFAAKQRGPILNYKPYGKVIDIDPKTGHELHKFKIFESLPSTLSRKATEALIDTRHSFDQAIYAACLFIGKPPRKDVHFPWRTSPTDLDVTLKKKAIPAELWNVIKREEPYPTGNGYTGGNDIIREIAKLANSKHTIGLTITPRISSYIHPTASGSGFVSVPSPRWDPVNNEMVMLEVSPGAYVQDDYSVQLQVALNVPKPLGDIPAIFLLNTFADKAEGFVKSIKSECIKIVG